MGSYGQAGEIERKKKNLQEQDVSVPFRSMVVLVSDVKLLEINYFLKHLDAAEQVQTLPVDHSNNSKVYDNSIL